MAQGSSDITDEQTECSMAIEHVSRKISQKFPQYPLFPNKFKVHCQNEAFEETDVLIDDVAEGFDESVILEAISQEIDISDNDKEPLCKTIHNLLSTFIPPLPQPYSLNLSQILTNCNDADINSMKKLVSAQVKLLEPNNKDISVYKVLHIGTQNNFPLLTYLVCSYQRARFAEYFIFKQIYNSLYNDEEDAAKHMHKKNINFRDVKLEDFISVCETMLEMDSQILTAYSDAMKTCIHRNGIFYILPLIQGQVTNKINDSLAMFQIYSLSLLLCVNDMIKQLMIPFPVQIDVWIIPKDVDTEDDGFLDDGNREFTLENGVMYCERLQKCDIASSDVDIDTLADIFRNVINTVLNGVNHKRMCIVIDRRDNDKKCDVLYAYLPKNTQMIPSMNSGQFLYESMINLTKKEIFPSDTGLITENTINAHSDILNMFVISLHLHKESDIGMYWHYKGSTNRFCVNDMVTLWPSNFIANNDSDSENESESTELVRQYILHNSFDELCDDNFIQFYEINTGNKWTDTVSPFYTAKPAAKRRRNTNEELEEKMAQYKRRLEAEEAYKVMRKKNRELMKRSKSANDMPKDRYHRFKEGEMKVNDSVVSILDTEIELKWNGKKVKEIEFIRKHNFDENGLLYFLGSYAKRKSYQNPALIPLMSVNASSLAKDSKSIYTFVGRECVRCMTDNTTKKPWIKVNIHPIYLNLKEYSLKHHNSHNAGLRHWTLEASNDGHTWIVLKGHSYESGLSAPGDMNTWSVNSHGAYYTQFRIFMTGKNSSGRYRLGCSGIELYGSAFGGLVTQSLEADFDEKLELEKLENDTGNVNNINIPRAITVHSYMSEAKTEAKSEKVSKRSKTWNNLFKKSKNDLFKKSKNDLLPSPKCVKRVKVKWNVYCKEYRKCVQNKGKVIRRLQGGFNETETETDSLTGNKKFMFGSSVAIDMKLNHLNEFRIKFESDTDVYCNDCVGVISGTEVCKSKNKWVTNTGANCAENEIVYGVRYVYWGGGTCAGGKIFEIRNENEYKDFWLTTVKWKSGQTLTVQIDCTHESRRYITFLMDGEKIYEKIVMICSESAVYFPIISTQNDDSKFTIV